MYKYLFVAILFILPFTNLFSNSLEVNKYNFKFIPDIKSNHKINQNFENYDFQFNFDPPKAVFISSIIFFGISLTTFTCAFIIELIQIKVQASLDIFAGIVAIGGACFTLIGIILLIVGCVLGRYYYGSSNSYFDKKENAKYGISNNINSIYFFIRE